MDDLIELLRLIHYDLMAIAIILAAFVMFKDCHGYSNSDIVHELKNIQSAISHKQMWKKD